MRKYRFWVEIKNTDCAFYLCQVGETLADAEKALAKERPDCDIYGADEVNDYTIEVFTAKNEIIREVITAVDEHDLEGYVEARHEKCKSWRIISCREEFLA